MKFLILSLVIALILEDNGTLQEDIIIDELTPAQQIELFKKYALDLVIAAIPPIRNNGKLMDGGCECLSGINVFENVNTVDAVMATMPLAKYHHKDLLAMQQSSGWIPTDVKAKDGIMKYIRLILHVLQLPLLNARKFPKYIAWKKYLLRDKEDTSTAATRTSSNDKNVQSLLKCLRTMDSLKKNEKFFNKLSDGFIYEIALIKYDDASTDNPTRVNLREIIRVIPSFNLKIARPESVKVLLTVLDALKDAEHAWSSVSSDSDQDSDSE